MRTLFIDIADVGAQHAPGDEVLLWAPRVRGSSSENTRVVSTAPKQVLLNQGVGEIEVEEGPLMVQLRCNGFADTEPRKVIVPSGSGRITLRQLFDATETYEPPVMSALEKILQRAEDAAGKVKDVSKQVESASTSASTATQAAQAATQAAETATEKAKEARDTVNEFANVTQRAEQSVLDAQNFAEDASAARVAAENARDNATQAAETAREHADRASQGGGGVSEDRARAIAGEEIAKIPPSQSGIGEDRAREIAAEEAKKLPIPVIRGVVNVSPEGDFTANLQAAINNPLFKKVVIPVGEFQLTNVINLDKLSGKELVGQGVGTVIKAAKNSGKNAFQSTSGGNLTSATLRDFVVDMSWETGDKPAHGFQITNASKVKFVNVTVNQSGGHGFLLQGHGSGTPGTSYCLIERCSVDGAGLLQNQASKGASGFGVLVKDNSRGNQIINNRISGVSCGMGVGGSATQAGSPEYTLVAGNHITMADNETIAFETIGFQKTCHHTIVTGNTLPISRDNGISIGSHSLVTNNTIGETWNHGIACSGVGTTISNNTIFNIGLENSTRLVNDPKDWGVICLDDPTNCVVTNNTYRKTSPNSSAAHMVKINLSPRVDRSTLGGNVLTGNVADKSTITKEWIKNVHANPANPDITGESATPQAAPKPAWETWFELDKRYTAWVTYWWADHQQPVSNWHPWLENSDVAGFAIFNPRSGPGDRIEPDFMDLKERIDQRGKPRLGYVRTTQKFEPPRELRPKETILNEVAKYVEYYQVQGVFLDEMVNGWSEDQTPLIPFYKDLYQEIKRTYGNDFLIVGNPGTITKEELLECADVLMTFESTAQAYLESPPDKIFPYHYREYAPTRFIHVIHDVINEQQARAVIAKAEKMNVAHLYLTTDTFSGVLGSESPDNNPWDHLPEPWLREINYAWARRQQPSRSHVEVFHPRDRYVAFMSDVWPDVHQGEKSHVARLVQQADVLSLLTYHKGGGPGDRPEPDFVTMSKHAIKSGVKNIIGVVDTALGERAIAEVIQDVDKHVSFYSANGAMFNNVSVDLQKQGYYLELSTKLKEKYGPYFVTVFNAKQYPPQEFVWCADVLVVDVVDSVEFIKPEYRAVPDWAYRHPATKFWSVIYNIWNQQQFAKVTHVLNQRNIGHVHLTDDLEKPQWPEDTPLNTVPAQWLLELTAQWARRAPLPVLPNPPIENGGDETMNAVLAALRKHGIIEQR